MRYLLSLVEGARRDSCILWPGRVDEKGYGLASIEHRIHKAHRLIYALLNGPVPKAVHIRHSCDTPLCINPHHLLAGTHADNMGDMASKGRWWSEKRRTELVNRVARGMAVTDGDGRPWPTMSDAARAHGINRTTVTYRASKGLFGWRFSTGGSVMTDAEKRRRLAARYDAGLTAAQWAAKHGTGDAR